MLVPFQRSLRTLKQKEGSGKFLYNTQFSGKLFKEYPVGKVMILEASKQWILPSRSHYVCQYSACHSWLEIFLLKQPAMETVALMEQSEIT